MECVIEINTFDNTRPVAANAQRAPWHMFETIPDAAAVTFSPPLRLKVTEFPVKRLGSGEVVEKELR